MFLYFGCRQDSQDNIYKDELATMKQEGILTDYFVALSREPGKRKVTLTLKGETQGNPCPQLLLCSAVQKPDKPKVTLTQKL
jgi:hypothetical protein